MTAIVAAGGRGVRLGASQPKQLLRIGGRSILDRSVAIFLDHPSVSEIVVALPADLAADPSRCLEHDLARVQIVSGGARRQDSVKNAFGAASEASDIILIHDAARPFASADLVSRTIAAAAESGAALAAVWARDTVKRADRPHSLVLETIARDGIALAQTPQAFRRDVLRQALALGEREEATDEATLAERAGFPVRIVEGEDTNIKVTTPDDLAMAEAIVRARETSATPPVRIGTGYDLHRLVEGRPLVLGGVVIPFERGLLGHSDADAICHAVTDAVLGAAAAGDIGRHFPDTDASWRGASSIDLLTRAVEVVRRQGFHIANVDVVVIAERPKLGPHVEAMRARVADALGVDVSRVSIKGKTNEGIGEIGKGEAIATHAIALLERS